MTTKQKILDAALTVLTTEGFKALTQTRVAEAAGLGQGNLTYHFPTRSDLLRAVVDESKERMVTEISKLPKDAMTRAKLEQILTHFALSKAFPRLMLALTLAVDEDPSLSAWFVETDRYTRQNFRALLKGMGWQVEERTLHQLRATVIGASLINLQQNTKAAEQNARLVIQGALQTMIDTAKPC